MGNCFCGVVDGEWFKLKRKINITKRLKVVYFHSFVHSNDGKFAALL